MNKSYVLYGHSIYADIERGLVRIHNDVGIKHAIGIHPVQSMERLVSWIQDEHLNTHGRTLVIGRDSFVMEIWGHLYFEYFLLKYRLLSHIIFPFGLYKRFRKSCEVIDCGERGKDPNRWIWDRLARYRRRISRWMPKIDAWLADR